MRFCNRDLAGFHLIEGCAFWPFENFYIIEKGWHGSSAVKLRLKSDVARLRGILLADVEDVGRGEIAHGTPPCADKKSAHVGQIS